MKQIGNYVVEDIPIGKGGMGQVLRGTTPDGSYPVAIKEILPTFVADVEYRKRIESEINFLKKLNDDNVVKVYDHFELNGNLYIVMELVEGRNIEQLVAEKGPLPWEEAVGYMLKLLPTLEYVHSRGIVHRDIKPGNIMIRPDGNVCLLDFGVAKDVSGNSKGHTGTVFGTVIGTDGYMSPEQAQGMSIDQRADIYALGCVFYFMLTGSHAFDQMGSELEMQIAITEKQFPRLSAKKHGLPPALQTILDNATDKNMTHRYQNCLAFADDLNTFMAGGNPQSNATANQAAQQINGAQQPFNAGQQFSSGAPIQPMVNNQVIKISVGREDCDIVMCVDNLKVSRHHADIECRMINGQEFYVYKDCSSNGTLINGRLLTRNQTMNIPKGENPEILLAGEADCRLDLNEVEYRMQMQRNALQSYQQRVSQSDLRRSEYEAARAAQQGQYGQNFGNPQRSPRQAPSSDSLFGAVKACFSKYATFSGRASRAEYWWFWLFNIIVNTALTLIFFASKMEVAIIYLMFGWMFAALLPSLAVMIRRLHDVGKSSAPFWMQFIPVVGFGFSIYLLVLLLRKGEPFANQYGNPTWSAGGQSTINMSPVQQDPMSSAY